MSPRSSLYRGAGKVVVWALAAAALVAAAVLNYRYGVEALARIATGSMDVHADFETFWSSAYALISGGPVYDTGARLVNLNPPLWVLLTVPFALLGPLEAYRLFTLVALAVSVGTLSWMAGESRLGSGAAVAVCVALVLSSPLTATLALGQMYPVLAFGLVGTWAADQRGMPVVSGVFLGVAIALKPTLAPALLWPLFRQRWKSFGSAVLSGAGATLLAFLAAGPRTTFEYASVLLGASVDGYWDNASLRSAGIRFFTENEYAENVAQVPWAVTAVQIAALGLVVLTAYLARGGTEWGLWAVVAATLLAAPISWHNYLVLLAPAVVLLFARERYAPGLLLVGLLLIPARWPLLWSGEETLLATFAISLYTAILAAHWLVFTFYATYANRGTRYRKSG